LAAQGLDLQLDLGESYFDRRATRNIRFLVLATQLLFQTKYSTLSAHQVGWYSMRRAVSHWKSPAASAPSWRRTGADGL